MTWFLEMLSPKLNLYFYSQRNQVSLVLKHCQITIPFLGARVSEFLWPMHRFDALLPVAAGLLPRGGGGEEEEGGGGRRRGGQGGGRGGGDENHHGGTSKIFFNVRHYFGTMKMKERKKNLISLLLHYVTVGEFVNFAGETVLGELLATYECDHSDTTAISHAYMLATKILERTLQKSNISNLSRQNLKKLKNITTERISSSEEHVTKGLDGYYLRNFLSAFRCAEGVDEELR
jgi:hypothetical protein